MSNPKVEVRCPHGQERWCRICGTVEILKTTDTGKGIEVLNKKEKEEKDYNGMRGLPMNYYVRVLSPQQEQQLSMFDEEEFQGE